MPGHWKPKHEKAAKRKAKMVADFKKGFYRWCGRWPIHAHVAEHFGVSTTWVTTYTRLAREYGYLDETEISPVLRMVDVFIDVE